MLNGKIYLFSYKNLTTMLKEIDGISLKVLWTYYVYPKLDCLSLFFWRESYSYNDFKL